MNEKNKIDLQVPLGLFQKTTAEYLKVLGSYTAET